MKNFRHLTNWFAVMYILFIFSFIGCSGDDSVSSDAFDLVGTWEITSIEGAPTLDASNSTWTFKIDGTYEWFLLLEPFDLSGGGTYGLGGSTLTCTGVIINVCGSNKINLTISSDKNSFSMLDDEGDRWTYKRVQN